MSSRGSRDKGTLRLRSPQDVSTMLSRTNRARSTYASHVRPVLRGKPGSQSSDSDGSRTASTDSPADRAGSRSSYSKEPARRPSTPPSVKPRTPPGGPRPKTTFSNPPTVRSSSVTQHNRNSDTPRRTESLSSRSEQSDHSGSSSGDSAHSRSDDVKEPESDSDGSQSERDQSVNTSLYSELRYEAPGTDGQPRTSAEAQVETRAIDRQLKENEEEGVKVKLPHESSSTARRQVLRCIEHGGYHPAYEVQGRYQCEEE